MAYPEARRLTATDCQAPPAAAVPVHAPGGERHWRVPASYSSYVGCMYIPRRQLESLPKSAPSPSPWSKEQRQPLLTEAYGLRSRADAGAAGPAADTVDAAAAGRRLPNT